jgi:hypothetical protein
LPDEIVDHASQSQQRIALGLDAAGIARTVRTLLGEAATGPKPVRAASR